MKKLLNGLFSILKIILLVASFAFVFYIILTLYEVLEKNILDAIDIFIPYFILLILLVLNLGLHQKQLTGNIFYNITCCLVFSVVIVVCYRTLFDENIVLRYKNDYNMAFSYFLDMMQPLKAMFYLLIGGNICLMFAKCDASKKIVVVDAKSESVSKEQTLNDVPLKKTSGRKRKAAVE